MGLGRVYVACTFCDPDHAFTVLEQGSWIICGQNCYAQEAQDIDFRNKAHGLPVVKIAMYKKPRISISGYRFPSGYLFPP
ncbi:hypothetical protein SUGI_0389310 [Cryptomeria japonica]|nr:hypothetical protein SUGI_0389310 [Cryptomeria japonica]